MKGGQDRNSRRRTGHQPRRPSGRVLSMYLMFITNLREAIITLLTALRMHPKNVYFRLFKTFVYNNEGFFFNLLYITQRPLKILFNKDLM